MLLAQHGYEMAARKPPTAPTQANLSLDQMRKGIKRLERVIEEIESFDATRLTERWGPEQKALESTIEATLVSVFGPDTVEYRRYKSAASLDHGGISIIHAYSYRDEAAEARQYVGEGKLSAIQLLKAAVKWLNEEIEDGGETGQAISVVDAPEKMSRKVFIVHGHDEGAQQTVARFIERIGFEAVILSEQANKGRTIIEKIEANGDVGFAVVLLTPDDVGGKTADTLRPRARQNVLLELGYFIARLSRQRVCALAKGDLEIPTDFAGVVWEKMDGGGGWKLALAKELEAAGFTVDWNKVMAA